MHHDLHWHPGLLVGQVLGLGVARRHQLLDLGPHLLQRRRRVVGLAHLGPRLEPEPEEEEMKEQRGKREEGTKSRRKAKQGVEGVGSSRKRRGAEEGAEEGAG